MMFQEGSDVKKFIAMLLIVSSTVISGLALAQLKDFSGKPQNLSDYTRGKDVWTVVILWASDCHACNVEAKQYVQFHEANKNKNIRMLGVSMDGEKKIADARAFIKRHAVTYPNLIGEFDEVAGMYESLTGGTWLGTPTILVYDPAGKLQAAQPGAVPVEIIKEFIQSRTDLVHKTNANQADD
jgi:peroxiredoxin